MRRVAVLAAVLAALWPAPAAAIPSGVLHAHTATAASHKFSYGDSDDRLQTMLKCGTRYYQIVYVDGPWVSRGYWSQAYCPSGYYRMSDAVSLRG